MAKRVVLTDGSGRYFIPDRCQKFDEATWWDGRNYISRATGSQWEHQRLYVTPGKTCILHAYSDFQGTKDAYYEVTPFEAAEWLVKNYYDDDRIPEFLRGYVADLEIE